MLRLARGIDFELVFCTKCQISWRWMYRSTGVSTVYLLWSFPFLCTLLVVAVPWWKKLNSICGRSCCAGLCRRAAPRLQRHKNGSFAISKSKVISSRSTWSWRCLPNERFIGALEMNVLRQRYFENIIAVCRCTCYLEASTVHWGVNGTWQTLERDGCCPHASDLRFHYVPC